MPAKVFEVAGVGPVQMYKRRGVRSLRLSIVPPATVRLTMPFWAPYASGIAFAQAQAGWIRQQLANLPKVDELQAEQAIGKAHHLSFVASIRASKVSSRLAGSRIIITYPAAWGTERAEVQSSAQAACVRALRREASVLLPKRLEQLANKHGYGYTSVGVKQLKRRWGSCDQRQNIVFNLFLMQLPWEQIDYVILHELVHTRHLNHSAEFWSELASILPNAQRLRKIVRGTQPTLFPVVSSKSA